MPWNNQGSGGAGKGPWGSGPATPDLEEILRRSQDRLRNVLPGGSLGGKGPRLILLAVIAIWGLSGFFRVDPDELGVVLRPSNRCSRRKSPASTVSISACG